MLVLTSSKDVINRNCMNAWLKLDFAFSHQILVHSSVANTIRPRKFVLNSRKTTESMTSTCLLSLFYRRFVKATKQAFIVSMPWGAKPLTVVSQVLKLPRQTSLRQLFVKLRVASLPKRDSNVLDLMFLKLIFKTSYFFLDKLLVCRTCDP